jgi:hypothetical protein
VALLVGLPARTKEVFTEGKYDILSLKMFSHLIKNGRNNIRNKLINNFQKSVIFMAFFRASRFSYILYDELWSVENQFSLKK